MLAWEGRQGAGNTPAQHTEGLGVSSGTACALPRAAQTVCRRLATHRYPAPREGDRLTCRTGTPHPPGTPSYTAGETWETIDLGSSGARKMVWAFCGWGTASPICGEW